MVCIQKDFGFQSTIVLYLNTDPFPSRNYKGFWDRVLLFLIFVNGILLWPKTTHTKCMFSCQSKNKLYATKKFWKENQNKLETLQICLTLKDLNSWNWSCQEICSSSIFHLLAVSPVPLYQRHWCGCLMGQTLHSRMIKIEFPFFSGKGKLLSLYLRPLPNLHMRTS